MAGDNRSLNFSPAEMRRMRDCCRAMGTSYADFIRFAVIQALDECEGYAREERLRAQHYLRVARPSDARTAPPLRATAGDDRAPVADDYPETPY